MPRKPRKRPRNATRRQPDPQRCAVCKAFARDCHTDAPCCTHCTHQEGTV